MVLAATTRNGVGIDPVSKYLRNLKTEHTRKNYVGGLKKFFQYLENPETSIKRPRDEWTRNGDETIAAWDTIGMEYLTLLRNGGRLAADDLVDFIGQMNREGFAPSTVHSARAAVAGFFEANGIELSRLDERVIRKRLPKSGTVAKERPITMEILRAFLPYMRTPYQAVAYVMLATGGRADEVLQLRDQDVNLDTIPARVDFRRETTKTKKARFSFLTPEAVNAVRIWLQVREEYLETARARVKCLHAAGYGGEKMPNDRLFPFAETAFLKNWRNALNKAGLYERCEETGRATIHPHGLRKYFRTYFGAAAGVDVAEVLMGHQGYLTGAYVRLSEKDLATAYEANTYILTVSQGGGGELVRKVADLEARNESLERQLREVRMSVEERNSATDQIWSDPRFKAELEDAVRRMQVGAG
jgi:integrase